MRRVSLIILTTGVVLAGAFAASAQQFPVVDRLADKVVQKYQTSSCEQLAARRAHPPTGERATVEANAIRLLHQNPAMRQAFLNRVAAPVANKLFECGMIP